MHGIIKLLVSSVHTGMVGSLGKFLLLPTCAQTNAKEAIKLI